MTKEEAKIEAQRLLSEANVLVEQAERLMDEHRFSMVFLEKDYCPKDLTQEEIDEGGVGEEYIPIARDWMSEGDGGIWMGSSDRC